MAVLQQSFKQALAQENPLQIVGVINPLVALMAQEVGFKSLYLSGAGVANSDLGLPDLAVTSLDDVLHQIHHITSRVSLPLLVDADTGWGHPLNVYRTFFEMSKAGAAGAHIEDQNINKRCGHRGNKHLVGSSEMESRIKAAVDGRSFDDFLVVARTDAIAVEGEDKALERALNYQAAGADMIFVEAPTTLETYKTFSDALDIPLLANMTEFGKTPLAEKSELKALGVGAILYPLSAFRAMNYAAQQVLQDIRAHGHQKQSLERMQTRDALYETLGYTEFEETMDKYLSMEKEHG